MSQKQLSFIVQNNKATRGVRFANYFIDIIVFYIFIFFFGVFLGILATIGIEVPLQWFLYLEGNILLLIIYLLAFCISFIYSLLNISPKVKVSVNSSQRQK